MYVGGLRIKCCYPVPPVLPGSSVFVHCCPHRNIDGRLLARLGIYPKRQPCHGSDPTPSGLAEAATKYKMLDMCLRCLRLLFFRSVRQLPRSTRYSHVKSSILPVTLDDVIPLFGCLFVPTLSHCLRSVEPMTKGMTAAAQSILLESYLRARYPRVAVSPLFFFCRESHSSLTSSKWSTPLI